MQKYGYLVDDNGQSEAIYSEENLSNIIRNMQKFGAIEETGVIDNSTLKVNIISVNKHGKYLLSKSFSPPFFTF